MDTSEKNHAVKISNEALKSLIIPKHIRDEFKFSINQITGGLIIDKIMKKEIDSQKYRREMHNYFMYKDWDHETTITYIKVFKDEDKITLEIETHRPGILIGKGGRFINGLEDFLKEELDEDIKIDLKECKLWYNLYN